MTGGNELFKNCNLVGVKKFSSHAKKPRSWNLLGILFKMFDEHDGPFPMGVSPPLKAELSQNLSKVGKVTIRKDDFEISSHSKLISYVIV